MGRASTFEYRFGRDASRISGDLPMRDSPMRGLRQQEGARLKSLYRRPSREPALFCHGALSARWTARLCGEVVPDAPLVASLNCHVREIRLARSAANLDAMHSRLEIERRDRRCRAVVLAINVELALRRYREDEPGGAPRLRL